MRWCGLHGGLAVCVAAPISGICLERLYIQKHLSVPSEMACDRAMRRSITTAAAQRNSASEKPRLSRRQAADETGVYEASSSDKTHQNGPRRPRDSNQRPQPTVSPLTQPVALLSWPKIRIQMRAARPSKLQQQVPPRSPSSHICPIRNPFSSKAQSPRRAGYPEPPIKTTAVARAAAEMSPLIA